jgi:hypothetical protein
MSAADTYDEAENRAPQLLAVSYTILSIVILSIAGRFYSRRHLLRAIHIEDWLALLACVSSPSSVYKQSSSINRLRWE